jgi:hypothetical protein
MITKERMKSYKAISNQPENHPASLCLIIKELLEEIERQNIVIDAQEVMLEQGKKPF